VSEERDGITIEVSCGCEVYYSPLDGYVNADIRWCVQHGRDSRQRRWVLENCNLIRDDIMAKRAEGNGR